MTRSRLRQTLFGCALACMTAAQASAAGIVDFGSQFANFTGQLGLSRNPNSVFLGALLDGMFVGNPYGHSIGGLVGAINFTDGDITSGS